MSLTGNIVNQISAQGLGAVTKPQGFDLNDDTFSKILEKSMNNIPQPVSRLEGMGMPAGFVMEPFDATGTEAVKETQPIDTSEVVIKELDMGDYFSNLLKTNPESNNGIFDMAKKHAANAYGNFGKNYISSLKDFIGDVISMAS